MKRLLGFLKWTVGIDAERTVEELYAGEQGFVVPWAFRTYDDDLYIRRDWPVVRLPGGSAGITIRRTGVFFPNILLTKKASTWLAEHLKPLHPHEAAWLVTVR